MAQGQAQPPADYNRRLYELGLRCADVGRDDDNGWNEYLSILRDAENLVRSVPGMKARDTDGMDVARDPFLSEPWSKEAIDVESEELATGCVQALERARVFERLAQRAEQHAGCAAPLSSGPIVDVGFPECARARFVFRVLRWRLAKSIDAHQLDEERAHAAQLRALFRPLVQYPRVIPRLSGEGIIAGWCRVIRRSLVESRLNTQEQEAMLRDLGSIEIPPITQALEGERLMVLDTLSRVANAGPAPLPELPIWQDRANAFFDRASSALAAPTPGDALPALSQIDADVSECGIEDIRIAMPALARFAQIDRLAASELSATKALLAIELFRARHTRYPATLQEVDADLLPQPPIDPFSGSPLKYRLVDAQFDLRHRSYLLYTVGTDRVDNGGKECNPPVNALGNKSCDGFDYVYNSID